jgi:hypothetical protein
MSLLADPFDNDTEDECDAPPIGSKWFLAIPVVASLVLWTVLWWL